MCIETYVYTHMYICTDVHIHDMYVPHLINPKYCSNSAGRVLTQPMNVPQFQDAHATSDAEPAQDAELGCQVWRFSDWKLLKTRAFLGQK